MLLYEQLFGNVFEMKESKCCGVWMKHRRKVKGEQVITHQMAQEILMLYQDIYFVVSVKLNFCQGQTHCIDNQDKVQFVTDTDNEFTECQTLRKNFQPVGVSPVSLHAFMKTLKSNISEAYKVQGDYLKDSESDSYDKNYMNEKVSDLVRLHKAMQEKLETVSHPERIQILTLVPDKWPRVYCSEYFNIFEYLV